ncbi:MAG: D-alanine--D-alanine ligase [Candidatus Omnitrophica bacterium]|nr:D-alanine--D-alanine ligase [Candidatus Omnitrophota bacterium]
MRIGLTFDLQTDPGDPQQAEFDPPATIDALEHALASLGHEAVRLGNASELLAAPERLRDVELVFNIAEGNGSRCREAWVPNLLELHGIPYVGSDALALMIGLDKVLCKRVAITSGIATPTWLKIDHPQELPAAMGLRFPLIVKPRYEGSGRGIDAGAVVHDQAALRRRVAWLWQQCRQPMLIEEYISGGEVTVLVIGNDPPQAYPAIQRPIDPVSGLSCHVAGSAGPVEHPLTLDLALDHHAQAAAVAMYEAVSCRDMARVDFRVDAAGQLFFLEINPLPSFDPAGTIGLLAEYLGITYPEIIGRILDAAWCRVQGVRRYQISNSRSDIDRLGDE